MMNNNRCGFNTFTRPVSSLPGNCGPCSGIPGPASVLPPPPTPMMPLNDPCPLRTFCDPSWKNACGIQPLVNPLGSRRAVTTWKINYLISNRVNHASHTDPDLVNPWGIVIFNNQLWIVNSGTDSITNYDLFGNKLLGSVTVRSAVQNSSHPTGIAINCGYGFNTGNATFTKAGVLINCTEHGTVEVYNPQVDPLVAQCQINQQLTGEINVYRGLAVANNILYLADFYQNEIDVFDSNYNRLFGFNFIDGDSSDPIPIDFAPSNIVNIGCLLYILYARKDPTVPLQAIDGAGNGFISVFNLDGTFVRRFTSRGVLNNPWGMIPAPPECGFPPGSFIVCNRGDGRFNVFDCNGRYVGPMLNQAGLPIVIEGARGMAPHYSDFSEIFFTSADDENTDGLVGSIVKDQVIYF
ncbi:hypothetical protein [Saudi moumouvirus]|uniref:NHL repeat-containing protein n=1 Tax=Moumouvirus sp. 'Monve' TaxID=1128131 RepID=H2EDI0_9VIRU|nr:hypothetical protein mv_L248 [Moumouvirus Monve]AQN68782.1 hypothetical protein [Saudi moumouvirus]